MSTLGTHSVVFLPDAAVDPPMDAAIRELLCTCFTKPEDGIFRTRRFFTEPPAYRWIALAGEALVGHVAAHDKEILAGEDRLRILGVAEVCVAPTHRGLGIAAALLHAAHEFGAHQCHDFAVLFGRPEFYRSSGYVPITNALRTTRPGGETDEAVHDEAMRRRLGAAAWPEGPIDLQGPVF